MELCIPRSKVWTRSPELWQAATSNATESDDDLMTWLAEALTFAQTYWYALIAPGAVGTVGMKLIDKRGERARAAVEQQRWEATAKSDLIKVQYPQRHEAFGAFLVAITAAMDVVGDQRLSSPRLSRSEAVRRLWSTTREAQLVIVNKISILGGGEAIKGACGQSCRVATTLLSWAMIQ